MNKARLVILLGCLTLLAACTKEVPYDYTFKEEVQTKDAVVTGEDFLLNVSVQDVSRQTDDGRPFMFGDNRRVRMEWGEKTLNIVEKERDSRYASEINDKVILEIPVEHVDYECAKDAYGDCTNKEAAKDASWKDKGSFKFKPEEAKSGAIEFLPILFDQQVGSPCFKELSSKVVGYELTKDAINIQVKRNYLQLCKSNSTIENSATEYNTSATFHYSLVRLSSVAGKDFKPVIYPKKDEDTFGFFATTYKERDIDGNLVQNRERVVMNHWNPNRQIIDYHLSDSFNKPSNKALKDATYVAIERFNQGLAKAKVNFRIKLHEPSGKNPGDIRNSMIVLAEDPYESAPLGYGPQTEDPVTGEIISARTIMYLAGLTQYVRVSYSDIGEVIKRENAKAAQLAAGGSVTEDENIDPNGGLIIEEGDGSEGMSTADMKKSTRKFSKRTASKSSGKSASNKIVSGIKLQEDAKGLRNYTSRVSDEYSKRDSAAYLKFLMEAKNCSFRKEASAATEIRADVIEEIKKSFVVNGVLRPWTSLSDAEKQKVIDLLSVDTWIVTLLHELGHNMGLRHNFGGSEDKENFYSQEELLKEGVKHEVPYSTIMEYGDDNRALPLLGKYDIAALKFGYARKVDVIGKNGIQEISVGNSLQSLGASTTDNLVSYRYCTDEHVGANPGCRRFDEGTTFSEIANYLIRIHKERYNVASTRSGLDYFSSMGDASYAQGRLNKFLSMRTFGELYERIKHDNNLSDDDPRIENDPQYADVKDLKNAALTVNRFLIDVIKTPDLQCAIISTKKEDAGKFVYIGPLSGVSSSAFDCWSMRLNADFKVVAQAGKSLNNRRHPENPNTYIDQIDVRGYWLDKWAASKALFMRDLSPSFNKNFDNAWDIKDLKPEISAMITEVLENKSLTEEVFVFEDGSEQLGRIRNDFHSAHLINQSIHPSISEALDIPSTNFYFSEVLSKIIVKDGAPTKDTNADGAQLQDLVSVKRVNVLDDNTPKGHMSIDSGSTRIYASPTNLVAQNLITDINVRRALGNLKEEDLDKLNTLLQESLKASKVITAEELTANVPALNDAQKKWLVQVSNSSAEFLAQKVNDLAVGFIMPEAEIIKVLLGLSNQSKLEISVDSKKSNQRD